MIEFANPAALWFLTLILPIVLLYLLKRRRQDRIVPSILLWKQALEDTQAHTPFQKLRSNLLLLLQILAVVLLTALLAQPYFPTPSKQARQWILVLDRSASMLATDEKPTRYDVARKKLSDVLDTIGRTDEVMLVSVASEASIVQNFSRDHGSVRNKLNTLQPEHVAGDWEQLLLVLKPLIKRSPKPKVIIASDFANFPMASMETLDFEVATAGRATANIGITRATIEPLPDTMQEQLIFFQIKNFSGIEQTTEVRIQQNNELLDAQDVSLKPMEQVEKTLRVSVSNTARFTIQLQPEDAFSLDNDFILVAGPRKKIPVSVDVSNPFLKRALEVLPALEFSPTAPIRIANELEQNPGLYLLGGDIPEVTPIVQWDTVSQPLRFVDAGLWRIWNFRLVQIPAGGYRLLETTRGVVGYARDVNGKRQVVVGFDIENSNLSLLAGFPIFIGNTLEWIHQGLQPAGPTLTNRIHKLEGEVNARSAYVNFANESESLLTPGKVQGKSVSETKAAILRQDFSMWFLLALLAVVILEWWVFHRKQFL